MENVILGIVVGFVLYWYVWAERFYAELEEYETVIIEKDGPGVTNEAGGVEK